MFFFHCSLKILKSLHRTIFLGTAIIKVVNPPKNMSNFHTSLPVLRGFGWLQKNLWVSGTHQPKPSNQPPTYNELLLMVEEIRRSPVDMESFIAIFSLGFHGFIAGFRLFPLEDKKGAHLFPTKKIQQPFSYRRNSKGIPLARPRHLAATQR